MCVSVKVTATPQNVSDHQMPSKQFEYSIVIVMHRYFIGISRVEFNTALYKDTWISLEINVFPFYTTAFTKCSLENKDLLPNRKKKQLFFNNYSGLNEIGLCRIIYWNCSERVRRCSLIEGKSLVVDFEISKAYAIPSWLALSVSCLQISM